MAKVFKSKIGLGLLLLGVIFLSACANGPTNPSAQLAKAIASARTPAEHDALAKYYDGEAIASRTHAGKYQRLANTTSETPAGGRGYINQKARYNMVINIYESEAAQYEVLAEQQRKLAQTPQS